MNQIVEQTHEQKVQMYMNVPVGELIEMLIEANRVINLYQNAAKTTNRTSPSIESNNTEEEEYPYAKWFKEAYIAYYKLNQNKP